MSAQYRGVFYPDGFPLVMDLQEGLDLSRTRWSSYRTQLVAVPLGVQIPVSWGIGWELLITSVLRVGVSGKTASFDIFSRKATGALSLSELRSYRYWIGENAQDVLDGVKKAGGWANVFRDFEAFPVWASRVRNYFNIIPERLIVLDEKLAKRKSLELYRKYGHGLVRNFALSGEVYHDLDENFWFQMSPSGTAYHFKDGHQQSNARSQQFIPVHKLVHPDGTGGSWEVIVKNPQFRIEGLSQIQGTWYIGATPGCLNGRAPACKRFTPSAPGWIVLRSKNIESEKEGSAEIEFDPLYQGSYNYAETMEQSGQCFGGHLPADMNSHSERNGFYLNPKNIWASLDNRVFPVFEYNEPAEKHDSLLNSSLVQAMCKIEF